MDYSRVLFKPYYQTKLKIDRLTERDRALLLFIILATLFGFWFFIPYALQTNHLKQTGQQIAEVKAQTGALNQKKQVIEVLAMSPDTKGLMGHYQELIVKKKSLEQKALSYSRRYISSKDLANLLHDLLKQANGVQIVEFSTETQTVAINPVPESEGASKPVSQSLAVLPTHYRLVLRGGYFPIMNYLKRLEELSWRLYWDKLDYTVTHYPEGLVTLSFYTLKPGAFAPVVQPGGEQ